MAMNVPIFIDISVNEQVEELREFFKKLGAEISAEPSEKGIEDDLHKIIGVCDVCFREDQGNGNGLEMGQLEEVLNGIVSMLALVTGEKSENLIVAFCEKLSKAPNKSKNQAVGLCCLKVLWSLYQSLEETSPMRFHVYHYLMQLAEKTEQIDLVYKDIETLKSQFAANPPSNEQMQQLLRLLHEVLLKAKKSEQASAVMIMLLGTYTTENASQAREEAQRCIIASLADPQTFLLDHLLQLKPVKSWEGDLIHDLLKIFVSEKLEQYQKFYENHKEFVNGLGLKHEENLTKMKLLTFMQMAESRNQITFGEIQQYLQLGENEVEDFLIDLLKTKLVRAKLDQSNQTVIISSTMHRTFTTEHWNNLHQLLTNWRANLGQIKDDIGKLSDAQLKMVKQQQQGEMIKQQ